MAVDFSGINNTPGPRKSGTGDSARADNRTEKPSAEGSRPAESRGSAADNVSLSASARAISDVEQQLREQPEIDDAKVESIRQALRDGTFTVNAEKLAQKMLDQDQSIFG